MDEVNIILSEKYVMLLTKESAWALGSSTYGGLYLTEDGVFFVTNNSTLASLANAQNDQSLPNNCAVLLYRDIANMELGSFKNLWKTMYTLRIGLKNGAQFIFMLNTESITRRWISEIQRHLDALSGG